MLGWDNGILDKFWQSPDTDTGTLRLGANHSVHMAVRIGFGPLTTSRSSQNLCPSHPRSRDHHHASAFLRQRVASPHWMSILSGARTSQPTGSVLSCTFRPRAEYPSFDQLGKLVVCSSLVLNPAARSPSPPEDQEDHRHPLCEKPEVVE
jgi:hypothetical protein